MNIESAEMYQDIGLNEIPADWELKKINKVALLNPDSLTSQTDDDLLIRYVDIESVSEGKINNYKSFLFKDAPSRARRKVVERDVIISTVRPYLKAFAMIKDIHPNTICSTGFAVLRAIEGVTVPEYLYHFIASDIFLRQLLNKMVGSNYPAVNTLEFEKTLIAIPTSLQEQRDISQVLINIDDCITKTGKLIEKYKKIKKGLVRDLLSGKVRLFEGKIYQETEFKDSEIGLLPFDRGICTIKTYIKFQKSGLSRRITTEDIGIPVLTSGNIVESKLNVDELKYWFSSDPQGANIGDYFLENEDILLCFINSVDQMGKVCIFYDIGRPCIYTTNLFRIKASEYCIPKFLFYLLDSFYVQREIKKIIKPAINQASFTKEDFFKIQVPLYELEEQREIIKILSSIDAKIEKELSYLEKLIRIKQGLMQDLLTGKVRVKVKGDGDE